ncbi:hypothetical protein GCK32_019781 [Trichostrongylus colubriformis]|uniref:Serpentine receptor class gamma n=1 Tax=Trichostrongylus colubriformis TaxID=6319 RepID=A0AAN8ESA4_TRICO
MSRSKHGRHERGLLLNTFIVFIFTMLMCLQQVTRGFAVFTDDDKLNSMAKVQFYWINDVMISVPPLSLLLFSTELRHDIVNFFRCERVQQTSILAAVRVLPLNESLHRERSGRS